MARECDDTGVVACRKHATEQGALALRLLKLWSRLRHTNHVI